MVGGIPKRSAETRRTIRREAEREAAEKAGLLLAANKLREEKAMFDQEKNSLISTIVGSLLQGQTPQAMMQSGLGVDVPAIAGPPQGAPQDPMAAMMAEQGAPQGMPQGGEQIDPAMMEQLMMGQQPAY